MICGVKVVLPIMTTLVLTTTAPSIETNRTTHRWWPISFISLFPNLQEILETILRKGNYNSGLCCTASPVYLITVFQAYRYYHWNLSRFSLTILKQMEMYRMKNPNIGLRLLITDIFYRHKVQQECHPYVVKCVNRPTSTTLLSPASNLFIVHSFSIIYFSFQLNI